MKKLKLLKCCILTTMPEMTRYAGCSKSAMRWLTQFFLGLQSNLITIAICAAEGYFLHIKNIYCAKMHYLVHKANLRRVLYAGIGGLLHTESSHCAEIPHLVHKAYQREGLCAEKRHFQHNATASCAKNAYILRKVSKQSSKQSSKSSLLQRLLNGIHKFCKLLWRVAY